jgi:hypothetical protein
MASGSHKEEEQLLKELATKEVTIYLDATYCNGEWTLRMRKRNRRARTSSQVYANQLNVHLDLSEGDVVTSGSADWLAVARAANEYFKGPRAGILLQPTNSLALGPRISLPRSSRSALPPPRDESVEAKQDNRRAHNGGNSTKKRKVPDVTVEDSEEFNEAIEPEVTAADCEGKAIGMKEFLWRRGWWFDGMTRQGFREPGAVRGESGHAATRWKVGDLVLRLEEDDRGEDMFVLYKVTAVPRGHKDVASQ